MNKKIRMKVVPNRQAAQIERGSVLILTIMAVLILSIMVTGLLNVGTTEIFSTGNYKLQKTSYYMAVKGVEEIRNLIYNYPDAQSVTSITRFSSGFTGPTLNTDNTGPDTGTTVSETGGQAFYITGNLKDMEEYTSHGTLVPNLEQLVGFKAPQLPAISLGGMSSIAPVVWKVNVTSQVKRGKNVAYSEIVSGVYSILTISY